MKLIQDDKSHKESDIFFLMSQYIDKKADSSLVIF
jgi:hypothetical protein